MSGRILIVDDVATNRIVLKVKLSTSCYEVIQATNGAEAIDAIHRTHPDLVLLSSRLPDQSCEALCRTIKSNARMSGIPVVVLVNLDEPETRLAVLRAGADDVVTKPINESVLLARLRAHLRAFATIEELERRKSTAAELGFAEAASSFTKQGRVAIVAKDAETGKAWQGALAPHLKCKVDVISKNDVLQHSGSTSIADVFVIASRIDAPSSGLRLLSELRIKEATRHAAVLIVSDEDTSEQDEIAFDLGASDLIERNFNAEELALRIRTRLKNKANADHLRSLFEDGLKLAVIDPLTGLYNRRYALPHVARIEERARSTSRNYAVMILDIDLFKRINDGFGHAAGDRVLVEVAKRLRTSLRAIDMVARIGGEEFLIAMPDTSLDAAKIAAERMRHIVQSTPVEFGETGQQVSVTVSIGVAMSNHNHIDMPSPTSQQLIDKADHALLAAKCDGRNQVLFSQSAA